MPKIKLEKYHQLLKGTPLKNRIFIYLQMDDYDNWVNGDYVGDSEKLNAIADGLVNKVNEWVSDGMPKETKNK